MGQQRPPQTKPQLRSTVPDDVVLRQFSRWVTSDFRRLLIVLDPWHGTREMTKLLDVNKEEAIEQPTDIVLEQIKNGNMVRF